MHGETLKLYYYCLLN